MAAWASIVSSLSWAAISGNIDDTDEHVIIAATDAAGRLHFVDILVK